MSDTCHTCKFALNDGRKDDASIPVYQCRRFPPSLPPLHDCGENQFPTVRKINWCGEFMEGQSDAS